MYYSYLCPTSVQLLALEACVLFFIIDFFISEVLVVLYFRVFLPSLIFFDIDEVKAWFVEKFNTYLTDLMGATISHESSSNTLPRAAISSNTKAIKFSATKKEEMVVGMVVGPLPN